ncbi:MAG: ring-cleaving dioxygenase [Chloroflexaceae bacterium]|nr:ring-cleaving dioxygenase [Chloroflexaceae bacterium]
MQLTGLHHLTAITGQASANVAFYTHTLGMRLVKKTVNQDDVSAYHLFYGDTVGNPGTELTFFDWPAAVSNRNGAGTIAQTALRVPGREALEWWANHLTGAGIAHSGIITVDRRERIEFTDPEQQHLALVNDNGAAGGVPWERSTVPAEYGIKGLDAVTLMVRDLDPLAYVLTEVLGFQQVSSYHANGDSGRPVTVFAAGNGGPGTEVHVEAGRHLPAGRLGRGGMHHVAFRTPNVAEQNEWRRHITSAGLPVSPLIDRFYFHSIYFRVPGNIQFEIATDGPGFATDEDAAHLGETLALPPFLAPRRAEIEAGLQPIAPYAPAQ